MTINNLQELKIILQNSIIKNIDINRSPKLKKNKELLKQAYTLWGLNYSEIKYLLNNYYNLENLHIFCKCDKKNNFINHSRGYTRHCSRKCAATDSEVKLKTKETRLIDIDENGLNSYQRMVKKVKQTKQERYNNPNYVNPEKAKQTSLLKRGVIHHLKLENYKQQKRDLWKDKNWAKINIEHNQISKLFNHGKHGWNNPEKNKLTNMKKRGVDHHTKTQEYKNRFKNNIYKNKIVENRYNTMKKNKSFNNRSKMEVRCFELLKIKFPDAEHSYRDSERYPFNCDMYIPSLDLFIECHFGFAHGGEPFNSNSQKHLEEVENCKIKQEELRFDGRKKNSYAEKIKVWTESDPLKLKTFLDNKLNFKIFYTEKEFLDWFKSL